MHNKKPLVLTYDQLVVGSSLEALYFSFVNKYKFIYTLNERPFPIEKKTFYLWKMLVTQLSLAGYNAFDNRIVSIKYLDANSLKIVTSDGGTFIVRFNKLFIFNDHNLYDFPIQTGKTESLYKVIDWLYTDSKINIEVDTIVRDSKFINMVEPFFRNTKSNIKRNFAVTSFLTEEQINSHNYDGNVVRIKLPSVIGQQDLEFVHEQRNVVDMSKNLYDDFDNVSYIYDTIEQIHEKTQFSRHMDYMEYLRIKLGIKWTQLGELPMSLE
jgi:hypothetical protein